MARPMKNSGALPCMTFSEMAFKGHNQHLKSLNKQYREILNNKEAQNTHTFILIFLKRISRSDY